MPSTQISEGHLTLTSFLLAAPLGDALAGRFALMEDGCAIHTAEGKIRTGSSANRGRVSRGDAGRGAAVVVDGASSNFEGADPLLPVRGPRQAFAVAGSVDDAFIDCLAALGQGRAALHGTGREVRARFVADALGVGVGPVDGAVAVGVDGSTGDAEGAVAAGSGFQYR